VPPAIGRWDERDAAIADNSGIGVVP
jgi:hypothetical protein